MQKPMGWMTASSASSDSRRLNRESLTLTLPEVNQQTQYSLFLYLFNTIKEFAHQNAPEMAYLWALSRNFD